jgi:Pectate lyase superfamily protein
MSEVTSVNGQTGAVVLTAADVKAVPTSAEGQPGGVATLDGSGLLPEAQLPGSVVSSSDVGFAPSVIWLDSTPEFYGAKGDGVTDDTAAFQTLSKALNEKGGGTGRLSAKTYVVDGYVWESGVCWEGRSASGTILKAKAGSANSAMITMSVGRVRDCGWKNIQFLPNGNSGQHCFSLYAQESEATSDGGVWQCYFENLRVGTAVSSAGAWTGCCFWFRGGATGSKLPHQYVNFRNVVAIRANTGGNATISRCLKLTGECNQFNLDGSCNLQGQETYGKTGTNVELSREFLFATTLTAESVAGASELKVASATGFEANKQFSLGEGTTNEILAVSSVEGTTIHLTGTTKFIHANGARCYLLSGTVGAPAENAPGVIGFDAGCTIQYGDLGVLADHCSNVDVRSPWMEGMSRGLRVRVSSASVNLHAPHVANISEGESNGTGEATVGSKTISKATGVWANGNQISGPGIPAGTTVESGGGTETLTLTAAVAANGTEGVQMIALVKGGKGEGYIAKFESASSGHIHDHYIYGATDQGVISESGNARVDAPTRGTASPATTSTGVVPTIASAETITIGNAREIVLTGSTSVKTILAQHATSETLRIRISNEAIRFLNTGNIDLQSNGEVHVWPNDVVTLMRTDTTSRTWKLVGVQRKQNTGASAELGAAVKIANNGKESGVFNASGARVGDYVLVEYTKAFAVDGVIIRGEVREEGKIHWWILNLSGAEITLSKGFIKGEALRPT